MQYLAIAAEARGALTLAVFYADERSAGPRALTQWQRGPSLADVEKMPADRCTANTTGGGRRTTESMGALPGVSSRQFYRQTVSEDGRKLFC